MLCPRAFLLLILGASPAVAHPEIEAALSRLNPLIAATPRDADLYLERGELYARHEDWITAEANYLVAAEFAPDHPRLAKLRGALALASGTPAAALPLLDRALARAPRDPEVLVLRSRARAALGQKPAAAADLSAALALIASPPPELFLTYAALVPPEQALRSLDAAIARVGPAISLQLQAIILEEKLGRVDAAVARLDAVAAQSERREVWLKRRGDLLARAGRAAPARAAYLDALAAIASLPDWLRDSPETHRLAAELRLLTAPSS